MIRFYSKVFLFIAGLLGIMIIAGSSEEPYTSPRQPWLPPIKQDADLPGRVRKLNTDRSFSSRPWVEDQRVDSEAWADFLEDLESRGYDVWDPEAEEVWEEFY